MTKDEFESLLKQKVTDDQYNEIEFIYLYHPKVEDKATIVSLYKIGGMRLMWDMDATARKAKEIEDRERSLREQIRELREEYDRLGKGEEHDGSDHEDRREG